MTDARRILERYQVPSEMPIGYAMSYDVTQNRLFCTGTPNELWKLACVLHIVEHTNPPVDEIEFPTYCDELSGILSTIEELYEFLTSRSIKIRTRLIFPSTQQQRFMQPRLSEPLVLFSGGLDSLAAALSFNKSVLFHVVTSNIILSKATATRNSCSALLRNPFYCGDCRFSSLQGGFSHTRGLLFLSAALNAATTLGIRRIVVGENGPLMINPSTSPAFEPTKNAHPRLLIAFQTIARELGYCDLDVLTPHKEMTKTEVCLTIPAEYHDVIMKSYSCSQTQGRKAMCGLCFGCFVRRLSLLSAGIKEPSALYETDPLSTSISTSSPGDTRKISDLKDSLTYYKRLLTEPQTSQAWNAHIPTSFFDNAETMLLRFALDLFLGLRNYIKQEGSTYQCNALGEYCKNAIEEIGQSRLDQREAQLRKQSSSTMHQHVC